MTARDATGTKKKSVEKIFVSTLDVFMKIEMLLCIQLQREEARQVARHYRTYTPAELATWIRKLSAEDNLHAFYICKAWLHLRAQVLSEQHNECQLCKQQGKFEPATTVHHIKTVRAFPWLALNKSNLMAVCDDCHYKIHHKNKPKWNDERW